MSLSHHPSEALLLDYALGSLAEGWSLAVAAHLSLCPMCRQQVAEMEALGGALMHDCPPAIAGDDLWQRVAARMDASEGLVRKVKAGIDENQWSMLFFIRLVPVVPFFVANLIPAFLGVPLYRFVISTFLGIIPGSLVFTSIGAGLGSVFARGETPDFGIIFEPHILLPILGLCALSVLPVVLKAVTGKKELLK